MRSISGPQRTILAGSFSHYIRVEVQNGSGSWVDISSYVTNAVVSADIDNPVQRLSLSLVRGFGTSSLAPLSTTSLLNRNNVNAYSPLLDINRGIRVSVSVVALGSGPSTYTTIFQGLIDSSDPGPEIMSVEARDSFAPLLDTIIEVERSYGSASPGTPVETVIQSIINDNILVNPPALSTPGGPPGWNLQPYLQQSGISVMEAIRNLALQIGWDLRGKWIGSNYLLSLFTPPSAVVQTTFSASEYLEISSLRLNGDDVRNFIEVAYVDSTSGQVQIATAVDNSSILKYGRRYMKITEAAASNIDTPAEAQAMADAALLALSSPGSEQAVETFLYWPVELGDYYGFPSNNVHFNSQQNAAVVAFRHELSATQVRTSLDLRGLPSGAYNEWIRLSEKEVPPDAGVVDNVPEILYVNSPVPVYTAGVITGWRLVGTVDNETNAVIITISSSLSVQFTSPNYTTAVNGPVTEYWVPIGGSKQFTAEFALLSGGSGVVTLVPATLFNPTDPIPRGGTLGLSYTQRLQRTPTTSIATEAISLTTYRVVLSVYPLTATIKYRYALGAAPASTVPWATATNSRGSTSFEVDVSSNFVYLEYYSVSTDNVSEELHSMVIDQDMVPSLSMTLSESSANTLTAAMVIDDDVVTWRFWAKRGSSPMVNGNPDDAFLKFTGNRQNTQVEFYAGGDGGGTSTWYCVARAYDLYGNWVEASASKLVYGATPGAPSIGALSNVTSFVNGSFLEVGWSHNSVVQGAILSRFKVVIIENGQTKVSLGDSRGAKLESDDTNSISGAGGWRRTCSPSSQGTPGAVYYTFSFLVELYDNGVLVGSYTTSYSGWFVGPDQGTAPTGTPGTITLSVPSGIPAVVASWGGSNSYDVEIMIQESTSSGFPSPATVDRVVVSQGTNSYESYGLTPGLWYRARSRYTNAYGTGSYNSFSPVVQIPPGNILL